MDDRPLPASTPQPPSTEPTVCYRHTDRPTRLSCTACGRPICVDCSRQAAVGQKCPECAAPSGRNRVVTAAEIRNRGALDGAPATKVILGVTVGIGLVRFVAPAVWANLAVYLIDNVQLVAQGELWRTVTAALLHSASLFHLGFNMWALYVFGPDLERRFGTLPFVMFYLASAAAGGAAFQITNDAGNALGASGAIFGLFGAYVISAFLARHTMAGRAGLNQLVPLLLLNLALPFIIPNIAWQAHLGGLLVGAAIMAVWRKLGPGDTGARVTAGSTVTLQRVGVAGLALVISLVVAALG